MIGPDTPRSLPCEQPEPVSLYCYEELLPSDDEQPLLEAERAPPETPIVYRVLVQCPGCDRTIRLLLKAKRLQVFLFEQLVLDGLEVICPRCGEQNGGT